jgi:RNA polymerase sigma-70 factor (ECF subfamily)
MTISISDETLFSQIRDENGIAFNTLFTRYYKKLCYYAYKITANGELSEEIVQELFIRIWESRDTLEVEKSVKAYLYRSTYNRSVNVLRSNKKFERNDACIADIESYQLADNDILYFELETKLFAIIDAFPEKQKNVFILKRFDNLSYKEIAAELNMSERMVEKYLANALRALREALSDYKKPFPDYFIFFL